MKHNSVRLQLLLLLSCLVITPITHSDPWEGALGGALLGGLIGGSDGAVYGAAIGGVAGYAEQSHRERQYEQANRRRYEQQRLAMERQRMEQEARYRDERARALERERELIRVRQASSYARAPTRAAPPTTGNLIEEMQRSLRVLGYNPGAIDGRPGGKTADAIRQYQTDKGLLVTGDASAPLLQHMRRNGG